MVDARKQVIENREQADIIEGVEQVLQQLPEKYRKYLEALTRQNQDAKKK